VVSLGRLADRVVARIARRDTLDRAGPPLLYALLDEALPHRPVAEPDGIYRDLIKLRKKYPAFYNDDVAWLQNTAPAEVISYLRRDAKDEFVIIINLSNRRVTGSVELTDKEGFEPVKISGGPVPVDVLLPNFSLKGFGWFIYHRAIAK